jgi:hypothetical protein
MTSYNINTSIDCPSSGQEYYGQDANYSINPMSFTKLDGSGNALPDSATSWVTVRDNVTGLIWENKTDDGTIHDMHNFYTWYDPTDSNPGTPGNGTDTKDFIDALNSAYFGGHSDWRLPTVKELGTIAKNQAYYGNPLIHTGYFPISVTRFWSRTNFASDTTYVWGITVSSGFGSGVSRWLDKYRGWAAIRAVRGASIDDAGYTDNGDNTVTDISTGLMWLKDVGSEKYWKVALTACERLNLGGYTDWRLPTIKELRSLVDYSQHSSAINTTYFPFNGKSGAFWSSTCNTGNTTLLLEFNYGTEDFNYRDHGGNIRCVRGGQAASSVLLVSPASRDVAKDAGTTTFSVSNTGTGTMPWTAAVTSGGSWLSITSGGSGTDTGTINCSFTSNTSIQARTATIRVTATGATDSPVDVTVTQAGNTQPVLSVSPATQSVTKDIGTTSFGVSNTGTGTMPWTAAATSGGSWLSITSGVSGTDTGTINCSFTSNTSTQARTATIRVTATGATGSPVDVTVTQAGNTQPVLSVSPATRNVAKDIGTTSFSVFNTGTGTMPWTAVVTSGGSWLSITSGAAVRIPERSIAVSQRTPAPQFDLLPSG